MSSGVRAIKLVVVGERVGEPKNQGEMKNALLLRYTCGSYPEEYMPSVFDNYTHHFMVGQTPIGLGLWSLSGQEDVTMRHLSYPQTDIFIVLFSVVNYESYKHVGCKWIPELKRLCPDVPYILVGCQTELRLCEETLEELRKKGQQPIMPDEGHRLAGEIGAIKYLECSARTGEGLKQVFDEAVKASLGPTYKPPSIIDSFFELFRSEENDKDEEELIICLKSYIESRNNAIQSDGSEYEHFWGGFFGGIEGSIKIDIVLKLVAKLENASEKKFSEKEINILLSDDLGDIVKKYPSVVEKIKGKWRAQSMAESEANVQSSSTSKRLSH